MVSVILLIDDERYFTCGRGMRIEIILIKAEK